MSEINARNLELDPIKLEMAMFRAPSSKIDRLFPVSLVCDPLANVWGTIRERDSTLFALSKEVDFTLASQSQVFQIKHYAAAGRFRFEKFLQFNYVLPLHPAA